MAKCPEGCPCGRHKSKGVKRDPEIGRRISASKMGHAVSEETREKISEAFKGYRWSEEVIQVRADGNRRHGHASRDRSKRTPEYRSWDAMKQRCNNPNDQRYDSYGGRGITYDPRWESFENFLADMGLKPEPKRGYSLDRIDNDGPYSPGNCRWATISEQNQNRPNFNPDKGSSREC